MIVWVIFLFLGIMWLVAVYKVFVLDDGTINSKKPTTERLHQFINPNKPKYVISSVSSSRFSAGNSEPLFHQSIHTPVKSGNSQKEAFQETINHFEKQLVSKIKKSNSNVVAHSNGATAPQEIQPIKLKLSHDSSSKSFSDEGNQIYKWPPVLPDGSIPAEDGTEIMPITGLKVPKFWSPPEDMDINKVGSHVNGEETIFLMIASYRDFQCRETITSAFMRADHPERLFIGAVDQVVPGDIGCLDIEIPCSVDNTQPICKYRDQISIYKMDAQTATGPVTARHVGDRMYRGQYYVMQMDAHCLFVRHWDTKIIGQFKSTGNEMAVLRYS